MMSHRRLEEAAVACKEDDSEVILGTFRFGHVRVSSNNLLNKLSRTRTVMYHYHNMGQEMVEGYIPSSITLNPVGTRHVLIFVLRLRLLMTGMELYCLGGTLYWKASEILSCPIPIPPLPYPFSYIVC